MIISESMHIYSSVAISFFRRMVGAHQEVQLTKMNADAEYIFFGQKLVFTRRMLDRHEGTFTLSRITKHNAPIWHLEFEVRRYPKIR